MTKKLIFIIAFSFLSLIPSVIAHCPLCTVAAGTGVAVARFYGIDDSIVGVFLGAFIISFALWFNKWLKNKTNFHMQTTLLVLVSFLLLVIPLYLSGIITNIDMVKSMPEHHSILGLGRFGIDKLMFGIIAGSIFIWGSFGLSDYVKIKRGKVLFPYQSISFMLITLAVLSAYLWWITR